MKKKKLLILGIAGTLILAYIGVKLYAAKVARRKLDMEIAKISNQLDIKYKDVSVDLIGRAVHVSGVTITPAGINATGKIDEIVIRDFDDKSNIPSRLNTSVHGFRMPV